MKLLIVLFIIITNFSYANEPPEANANLQETFKGFINKSRDTERSVIINSCCNTLNIIKKFSEELHLYGDYNLDSFLTKFHTDLQTKVQSYLTSIEFNLDPSSTIPLYTSNNISIKINDLNPENEKIYECIIKSEFTEGFGDDLDGATISLSINFNQVEDTNDNYVTQKLTMEIKSMNPNGTSPLSFQPTTLIEKTCPIK